MILRIKDHNETITQVNGILSVKTGDDDTRVTASSNTINISTDKEPYTDWYSGFTHRKEVSMYSGGVVNDTTQFNLGIAVYTGSPDRLYIKTICGSPVDSTGNIQLLSGSTLDIVPINEGNRISFEQIKVDTYSYNAGEAKVLNDMNICLWYLYHTFNSFIYRLNVWNPGATSYPMFTNRRLLGNIQSYQAIVAAWNVKVWRKSFLWEISPVRESISFNIGYIALACKNSAVSCKVTITNKNPANETTKFFTIYDQGISSNMSSSVSRSITKTTKGRGDVDINGSGSDSAAESGEDWSSITIDINMSDLKQGDYYKASFALSVAQNETTALYYQKTGPLQHEMDIATTWVIDEETFGFITPVSVPALLLYEDPEGEEEE